MCAYILLYDHQLSYENDYEIGTIIIRYYLLLLIIIINTLIDRLVYLLYGIQLYRNRTVYKMQLVIISNKYKMAIYTNNKKSLQEHIYIYILTSLYIAFELLCAGVSVLSTRTTHDDHGPSEREKLPR